MINQLEKIALNIFVIHSDRTGVIRNTSLQFFGSKKREREKERKREREKEREKERKKEREREKEREKEKNRLMYWKLSLKTD